MESNEDDKALIDWLQERGHTPEEIKKILAQVEQYQKKMQVDSVMDSIGAGSLNLDTLIKEALGE